MISGIQWSRSVLKMASGNLNWLLVEWKSGGRDVVFIEAVVSPLDTKGLKIYDTVVVNRLGEPEEGKLVARAGTTSNNTSGKLQESKIRNFASLDDKMHHPRARVRLDAMIRKSLRKASPPTAGPSVKREREEEEEPEDFCSSASSWVPSDDEGTLSADSEEIPEKKIKLKQCKRQYSNKRTSKTPSHKATPLIPKSMQSTKMMNRNRYINQIEETFQVIFKMIRDLKQIRLNSATVNQSSEEQVPVIFKAENLGQAPPAPKPYNETIQTLNQSEPAPLRQTVEDVMVEEEINSDHELNRSGDNVLITNKITNAAVKTVQNKVPEDSEWVPIGSGKTLIHKDKFKKVRWKSYTIATRTLLLAVFPRRVLATHSLTGKKSPAFQDKPAKMCLDTKMTTDIIYEVMDRFNVKENLVRSIITTKCADESKMWKNRHHKRNARAKTNENTMSPPPPPPQSPPSPVIYLEEQN